MEYFNLADYSGKNSFPKMSLFFGLGFLLLSFYLFFFSFSMYTVAIFGMGILFVLFYAYDLYEPLLTITYAIGLMLSILGLSQMIFNKTFLTIVDGQNLFVFSTAYYLYPALSLLRAKALWHRFIIYDGTNEIEKHEKGYSISLDAMIFLSTIIIFYTGISNLFGVNLLGEWLIGYTINIGFLLSVLSQKETSYKNSFGNKINHWALNSSGIFIILMPVAYFITKVDSFEPNKFFINIGFILAGILILVITHFINKRNINKEKKSNHI